MSARLRRWWEVRSRAWWLAAAVAVLLGYGVVGYLLFGYSVIDAVYMTVLVLTTEGFVSTVVLSTGAKLFTISVALLAVTVFLAAVGAGATALVEGRLSTGSRRRGMTRRVDRLHDHHIICAYGRVGRAAARELAADQEAFVVIEARPELEEQLRADGAPYLIGDSSSEALLRSAGIDRARGLVCAVDSDAANVYITVVARSLNPTISIVARASEDDAADRLYHAGADRVVSPYTTSGRRMAMLALHPEVVEFFDIARRDRDALRLEELYVPAGSELIGKELPQLCGTLTALLIRRAGGELILHPGPDTMLVAGDAVVVFGQAGPTTRSGTSTR